jgi:hypothetical protein
MKMNYIDRSFCSHKMWTETEMDLDRAQWRIINCRNVLLLHLLACLLDN